MYKYKFYSHSCNIIEKHEKMLLTKNTEIIAKGNIETAGTVLAECDGHIGIYL
jgi:hypothetical protein